MQRLHQIDVVHQLEAKELTSRQASSLLAGSGWGLAEVPNLMITFAIWLLLAFWSEKLIAVLGLMRPQRWILPRKLAVASWAIPALWAVGPRLTLGDIWQATATRGAESHLGRRLILDAAWLLYHGALIAGYVVSARAIGTWGPAANDIAAYDNLHIPFGSESLSLWFSLASLSGCLLMIPAMEVLARRFETRRLQYLNAMPR